MYNVFKDEILSEDWCNLIFEGRNKDYGAYELRRTAENRYRRALWVIAGLAVLFIFALTWQLAVEYIVLQSLDGDMPLAKMKPLEVEEGHELKAIATSRPAPRMKQAPDATQSVPDIVEVAPPKLELGIDGPEVIETEEVTLVRLQPDSITEQLPEDLPVEGPQLTPTEIVEQMPQFPGGTKALMKFLDENIMYPAAAMKDQLSANVEVSFYVDAAGNVCEPQITKSFSAPFDRTVMEAIKKMPQWKPGRLKGKAAMVKVRLPVEFKYQE